LKYFCEVEVMRALLVPVPQFTFSRRLSVVLLFCSFAFPATTRARDPETLLGLLEKVEFDVQHPRVVKEVVLRREPFTITFDRGHVIFLRPVDDLVTGLYFWGSGIIVGVPPSRTERQQLNLFTGAPVLNERFREALIRFSDDTWKEMMAQLEATTEGMPSGGDPSSGALQNVLKGSSLMHYRLAADLMNGRKTPLFSAKIVGSKLGTFDFTIDSRKAESVMLGQFHRASGRLNYDTWCSFSQDRLRPDQPLKFDMGSGSLHPESMIDVLSYQVETRIDKRDRISGQTEVEYQAEQEGEWLLAFDLARSVRVSQVLEDEGHPLTFFQNGNMSDDQSMSRLGPDSILVLLKQPLRFGQKRHLRFTYSGDVISQVGKGVFYVGSRGSWYPNVGSSDRAKYSLSFHYPRGFTVVATGERVKEWEDSDQKHSVWESQSELPMAGFNYGDYEIKSTLAGRVPIEVYANRGIENVYLEVMSRLEQIKEAYRQRQVRARLAGEELSELIAAPPDFSEFDTTQFAIGIAQQVARALLFFEPILGDFPFGRLAVSQIPGKFSQGWPTLLYVTSLSFLGTDQRARLGIGNDMEANFIECLHAHELAHQWWGNQVIGRSYHDLWMFEGFSSYLSYLFLNEKHPEGRQFREVMHYSKEKLLMKNSEGQTYETAGPIWLGARLASSKFPDGYSTLIYNKGAWVLHMLRYVMRDPNSTSDQNFRTLMRSFLTTFQGQSATTEDLKRMVEKNMSKAMDLEGNRKMDWFFDQWVYDTGIPTYRLDYSLTPLKSGEYQLKGKIKQQNVSENFIMPVEVFGRFTPNRMERVGRVVVVGAETDFRFTLKSKPRKVTLDENNEILCQNTTV
jgi:hypothetical protein